jgi:hypothetical protein
MVIATRIAIHTYRCSVGDRQRGSPATSSGAVVLPQRAGHEGRVREDGPRIGQADTVAASSPAVISGAIRARRLYSLALIVDERELHHRRPTYPQRRG